MFKKVLAAILVTMILMTVLVSTVSAQDSSTNSNVIILYVDSDNVSHQYEGNTFIDYDFFDTVSVSNSSEFVNFLSEFIEFEVKTLANDEIRITAITNSSIIMIKDSTLSVGLFIQFATDLIFQRVEIGNKTVFIITQER